MTTTQAWIDPEPETEPGAWGVVPVTGRGSLPFALVQGESLVAAASWALAAAGADLLDFTASWPQVQATGRAVAFHDPLCPLTPVTFLRAAIASSAHGIVAGFRPVTDTVKQSSDGSDDPADADTVGATVDRESLLGITSPIVLPADVVGALDDWPDTDDFAALVVSLRSRFEVVLLEAPALGGRVYDESAVRLLEALSDEQRDGG